MKRRLQRLSRPDFKAIRGAPSRKLAGEYYLFSATPLPKGGKTAYACVISKKVAPRAVDRNRAKRQCRAAIQEATLKQPLPGIMLVAHIKPSALKATYKGLLHDVSVLLSRLLAH